MSVLYIKTGRNLIALIVYHSTNIIVGQLIPWTSQVSGEYLLAAQSIINIALAAVLAYLPIFRTKTKLE